MGSDPAETWREEYIGVGKGPDRFSRLVLTFTTEPWPS